MNIGIIGAEEKKFTLDRKAAAFDEIYGIIRNHRMVHHEQATIVSGHCHLGGVDIWAEDAADEQGCPKLIFPPKIHVWEGGYKQRNIEIAEASDVVYVIVVAELPPGDEGRSVE